MEWTGKYSTIQFARVGKEGLRDIHWLLISYYNAWNKETDYVDDWKKEIYCIGVRRW